MMNKSLKFLRVNMIVFQILIMVYLFIYGGFLGRPAIIVGFLLTAVNLIYILYELEVIHISLSKDEEATHRLLLVEEEKKKSLNHIKNIKRIYKNEPRETLLHYIDKTQKEYYNEQVLNYDLEIINIILQRYLHICENNNIQLSYNIQENVKSLIDSIHLSPEQLCTVLGNLLDNAIDAMPKKIDKRHVHVTIVGTGYQIVIRVKNTGHKIPDDVKEKLFNYGFSTKREGRGAGLFIVYKLAQKTGAKLSVTSDDEETYFELLYELE